MAADTAAGNGVSTGTAAVAAVEQDDLLIPLIDFSQFTSSRKEDSLAAARAILDGFQRAGFIYLKNHGIPPTVVEAVFARSAAFFRRPQAQKDALAWSSPESNRGYVAHGREKVTQLEGKDEVAKLRDALPDLKESMEIGRDGVEGMPNMWPDRVLPAGGDDDGDGTAFRETMTDFFERCKALHVQVMRAVAVALGLDAGWFDGFTDAGDNTLRLLHYPPVPSAAFAANAATVRAGEHSDYGSVTLLFQDARGGLQVLSPAGTFVDATPIPGTIVVNAGDLLARWSNDTIKSTKHRVVEPPTRPADGDTHPARYSVAYFCNPNFDSFIDAIPGTYGDAGKKYEGVNSGEYLARRLAATY